MPNNDDNNFNDSQARARYEQNEERENQLRRRREESAIEKVFADFPAKFKVPNGDVLRSLGGSVKFDADGVPRIEARSLHDALVEYSKVNNHAVAQTVGEIHDGGLSSVKSKQDLTSSKAKSDFITAHGLAAFERLPLIAPVPLDESTLTFESYRRLPVSVKVKLINKYGEGFSATLKAKEQEQLRLDRLAGIPVGAKKK